MSRIERFYHKQFFGWACVPWRWPSGDEREADWEQVRFANRAGSRLAGLYGPATASPKGTVVCAHPTHPAAKGFFLHYGHARLLREAGYHVLLFDFNGFGESEYSGFGFPLDVLAAGRIAQRRAPELPVGLLGVCSGAAWSFTTLGYADHPFTAAVAEAPFATLEDYFATRGAGSRMLSKKWLRLKTVYALLRLGRMMYAARYRALQPIEQVGRLQHLSDVLFVYGTNDRVTPMRVGQRFLAACNAHQAHGGPQCSLWEVPDAPHLKALPAAPEAYRQRIVDFFDRVFASRPGAAKASMLKAAA